MDPENQIHEHVFDEYLVFNDGVKKSEQFRRDPRIQKLINEHKQDIEHRPLSRRGMMSRQESVVEERPYTQHRVARQAAVNRPPSAPRGSAVPGTASRLTSAMMQQPPSRGGLARALSGAQVSVVERPVTQQGLSGLRPSTRLPQARQVQDKRFFEGLLQMKIRELSTEVAHLTKDIENHSREQATFLVYDKRVKEMAAQLTDLQGQLADYNLVVDKMNTETQTGQVDAECRELRALNDKQASELEELFSQRQLKDGVVQQLQREIDQERLMADNLLTAMSPSLRSRYAELQETNSQLQHQMEELQQELDTLTLRKTRLEDQLSLSRVKQEAVRIHHKLREAEGRRDALLEEERSRSTPAQEREQLLQRVKEDNAEMATMERQLAQLRESVAAKQEQAEQLDKVRAQEREQLLQQVKEDNAEMATMERQLAQLRESVAAKQEQAEQLDKDLAESQSERHQKYRELRRREETMEQFLSEFEQSHLEETARIERLEAEVVALLQEISLHLVQSGNLPSTEDFTAMKAHLSVKETELEKSRTTFDSLCKEHRQLQFTLEKVGAMEEKMSAEMAALQGRMSAMQEEMGVLGDLDGLRDRALRKKLQLQDELQQLSERREPARDTLRVAQLKHSSLQKQLHDNETHAQLSNLERKLAQLEQNNFAMKEFVASKKSETNYEPLKRRVIGSLHDYNCLLKDSLKSGRS